MIILYNIILYYITLYYIYISVWNHTWILYPKHGMLNSEIFAKLVSLGEIQTIPDWSRNLCLPFPPF